jgi:hypothetical protein
MLAGACRWQSGELSRYYFDLVKLLGSIRQRRTRLTKSKPSTAHTLSRKSRSGPNWRDKVAYLMMILPFSGKKRVLLVVLTLISSGRRWIVKSLAVNFLHQTGQPDEPFCRVAKYNVMEPLRFNF